MKNYQPVIGLEIHIELATQSKMFCGCPADHFGVEPNTHTCPVCLGLPGALPVPNKKAIEWTILLAQALDCKINQESHFDRKNYFYPDLAKGYQITQYEKPFGENGKFKLNTGRIIRIRRVHLEEDTGKLQHTQIDGEKVALVDFNRSGVPLVEIVTEPDFRSIEEVDLYIKGIQIIVQALEISNANMEEGSMRLEPSISLLETKSPDSLPFPMPESLLPKYRVELKNINSFRFTRKALEYEIGRQTELLESGEKVLQQTRGWSEDRNATFSQRGKEEEHDYRYFPEPDIPPLSFTTEEINRIGSLMPELPDQKKNHYIEEHFVSQYNATVVAQNKEISGPTGAAFDIIRSAREEGKEIKITETDLANAVINKKIKLGSPEDMIKDTKALRESSQVNDNDLEKAVNEVLAENQKAVEDFKKGKAGVLGFLIASAVKKLDPKTDRQTIAKRLQQKLQ
jgi:aspartyl-tRNA(Asn)/glutamyl-tRNA(Gln) amidotransferase subunit B